MFSISLKKVMTLIASGILATVTIFEFSRQVLEYLTDASKSGLIKIGYIDFLNNSIPTIIAGVAIFLALVFLINLISWPIYRYLVGSKKGKWIYVVQNVRPRTFNSGEGIQFDALYGLKESQLMGVMDFQDSIFKTKIKRADVHYYNGKESTPGDFRGTWKSDDVSVSDNHIRIKYNINVKRQLDGEKATSYVGYYLLEPSPDVTPVFGGEVWEGVVFTVNQFGGLFGLVYAERITDKSETDQSKPNLKTWEFLPTMFKRIRTPGKEKYVLDNERDKKNFISSRPAFHDFTT